jgi:Flp pilus assembly protein TadG
MPSPARSEHRGDAGQSTVELALCLPLVCMLLLGVVQVALVVRAQLAVQLAARDAARAASVSADGDGAARAAAASSGILDGISVGVTTRGDDVVATVTYVERTDVPLIGLLVPDLTLRASASMLVEPPP